MKNHGQMEPIMSPMLMVGGSHIYLPTARIRNRNSLKISYRPYLTSVLFQIIEVRRPELIHKHSFQIQAIS